MRKYILFVIVASLCASCGHKEADPLAHHHHDHGHGHAEGEESGEIVLEPEIAESLGVEIDSVAPGDFHQVISVSGQIVDAPNSSSIVAAPVSGIVKYAAGITAGKEVGNGAVVASISPDGVAGGNANAAAKAALDAAQRELDRVTPLYQEGIVSAKTYNEALQAYQQAKAGYSAGAASGTARTVSGGVITSVLAQNGQYVEAGAPLAMVSSTSHLTLRADLPEKYYQSMPQIATANIIMPYGQQVVSLDKLHGKKTASSQAVAASRGYLPIYFTFDNDGSVIPGSIVKVMLIGQKMHNVLTVPVGALSEQQGRYFVYEQLDEECYAKRPVEIGGDDGERVQILGGLEGGEKIVSNGVVAVRIAETSAVAPEGHSHNH